MVTNRQKRYAYLMNGKDPEIIIKEEKEMRNNEITMEYITANEEERLTHFDDTNASIIWNDEDEEYIVVYWMETWEGVEVLKVKYTGVDDMEIITNRLYNQGYMY